jgi:transcriptional antiterminator RfaH
VADAEELMSDLKQIRQLIEQGPDVRPEPRPLTGRRAIVKTGAMAGLKGTITKVHSQHRLTVVVNFMQQGASVLVDEADLEILD